MSDGGTLYADEARLRQWFAHSAPGSGRITYAMGPALDPAAGAVRLVAEWLAAGHVICCKARIHGQLHHMAERACGMGLPDGGAPLALDADFARSAEGRMLALLDARARDGLPCPSYARLAKLLDLRDRQAARHRYNILKRDGHITESASDGMRVVKIVATGISTAGGRGMGQPAGATGAAR